MNYLLVGGTYETQQTFGVIGTVIAVILMIVAIIMLLVYATQNDQDKKSGNYMVYGGSLCVLGIFVLLIAVVIWTWGLST